jgi:hypothetical protein
MAMVAPNPDPFDWKYGITQSDHDANMYQITSGAFNAPPKSYFGRQVAALFLTVLKTVPGVAVLEDYLSTEKTHLPLFTSRLWCSKEKIGQSSQQVI